MAETPETHVPKITEQEGESYSTVEAAPPGDAGAAIWADDGAYRLAVDTSTEVLSLALARGREICGRRQEDEGVGGQARRVLPLVESLLNDEGIDLKALAGFVVSNGPGSFTGIRIGVASVRALAWALKLPVATASTLDALAWNAREREGEWLLPLLDARKREVYGALYRVDGGLVKRHGAPGLFTPEALVGFLASEGVPTDAALAVFGRGYRRYKELLDVALGDRTSPLDSAKDLPDAGMLFWASEAAPGDMANAHDPIYLRRSEAEVAWDARNAPAEPGSR